MRIVSTEQIEELRSIIGDEKAKLCSDGLLQLAEVRIYFSVEEIMSSDINDQGKDFFRAELRRSNGRFALGIQAPQCFSNCDH